MSNIPRVDTTFEDKKSSAIKPGLANIECKIGAASKGTPFRAYILSGDTAKQDAKALFGSGPLLDAIEDAFDSGSSEIHAVRVGTPEQASLTIKDMTSLEADTMQLLGEHSANGNNHYVSIAHEFTTVDTGQIILLNTSPKTAVFINPDASILKTVELDAAIITVLGVCADGFKKQIELDKGFRILGTDVGSNTKIWHYNNAGSLIAADTIDITSFIPTDPAETASGIVISEDTREIIVSTDKSLLIIDGSTPATPSLLQLVAYAGDLAIPSPDICDIAYELDLFEAFSGGDDPDRYLLLDKTANKIYRMLSGGLPAVCDIAAIVGSDTPAGLSYEWQNGYLNLALASGGDDDLIKVIDIDWDEETPVATLVSSMEIDQTVVAGASYIDDAELITTITIQDRNESPIAEKVFSASGSLATVTSNLAAVISDGYSATLLVDNPPILAASFGDEGIDPDSYTAMSGGSDGSAISNSDYLAGLEATKPIKSAAWIHAVGASSGALWTAILTHCSEMAAMDAERFAVLETPLFTSSNTVGGPQYKADVDEYVATIVSMMALVGDKNAAVFCGQAKFMGSDGVIRMSHIAAAATGTMAGLPIQKSLVNKKVSNVSASAPGEDSLFPAFSDAQLSTLTTARVNTMRLVEGLGYVLTENLTGASPGSDYNALSDLRVSYFLTKSVRQAAQAFVGEDNDDEGEGLELMVDAGGKPCRLAKRRKQIQDFTLTGESVSEDRNLGNATLRLGIRQRKVFKYIDLRVGMASAQ